MASFLLSLSFAAVTLPPRDAFAGPPNAAEKETARRLMDDGKARMKANDLPKAIEDFQKAHDIMHVPTTGIALAKAQLAAGHLVEARDAALEVARLPKDPGEPAVFDGARKQARDLDGQLRPRIPMLRIRIHGGTATRVAVDDFELASSIVGEPVAVNPGKRVVTARAADGAEVKGEIDIAEREVREIELTFGSKDGSKPPVVTSNGGSSATAQNATPPSDPRVTTSNAQNGEGDRPGVVRTKVATGLLYGGAIAGGVGVIAGIVTGAMTLSKAHNVTPQCDNNICAPGAKSDLDTALTLGTVSTIAFIVGAAGAVAAVVGVVLPKKLPDDNGHPRVVFGPTGVTGSF